VETGNAITQANLPTINILNKYYPKILLQASGLAVGLPWGVRGNSEVGHQSIGVGQIIFQYLPAIDMAIQNGSFSKNKVLLKTIEHNKKKKSSLHLVGLVSDGSVHSHISHLSALLGFAKSQKVKDVFIHIITDGRDTPPDSAKKYINMTLKMIDNFGVGQIATVSGRYYAMDRNNNWDRTEKAVRAMVFGEGIKEKDPIQAVDNQYKNKVYDENLEPVVMVDKKERPIGLIEDEDSVICFNFRKDRSRQITKAFVEPDFNDFDFSNRPKNIEFATFTEYEKGLNAKVIFPEQKITTRLGEILSKSKKRQLRIAETEKYAHVTYFFNGGVEKPYPGEDHIMVLSKKIKTYADLPQMSAEEVTDKLLEAMNKNDYDFILVNYANPDMVGHTGELQAGIKAVEKVDSCLAKLVKGVEKKNGQLLITADHGNVEEMIKMSNMEKDTEHSTNPVPCWHVSFDRGEEELQSNTCLQIEGMIIDLAPTILELLGIKAPKEMTGRSLLPLFKNKI